MRRVMLDAGVPDEHRVSLADEDVAGLTAVLCVSEPAHYRRGATEVVGDDAMVCGKSAWWERLQATLDMPELGRHLLAVQGFSFGVPVVYRVVDFELSRS